MVASHEQDPLLTDHLRTELSGILAWAVEGLRQLRAQGHFTIPPSSIAAVDSYRAESDPERLFATHCLERIGSGGISPSVLYDNYVKWCQDFGYSATNVISFGRRIAALDYGHTHYRGKKRWLVKTRGLNEAPIPE